MFKFDLGAVVVFSLTLAEVVQAVPWHSLGRAPTANELAAWDIDVRPDGTGLPPGQGSVAQGQEIYDSQCASCHGVFGESNEYMALVGGIGSLATETPQRTIGSRLNYATTLWDYINRAMPFQHSKSLTVDQVYAVTAYVLNLNDIVTADAVLDQLTLPQVQMPNRDGFTRDHGFGSTEAKADVDNNACMHECVTKVEISSALPAGFIAPIYGDIRAHFRGLAIMNHEQLPMPNPVSAKMTTAPALLDEYGCMVCHGIDKAIVGPAFIAIAARYSSDETASARLAGKIKNGGAGVWGTMMMPPQTQVPDGDISTLVEWIVAGAHTE